MRVVRVVFRCPRCYEEVRANVDLVDTRWECPECGQMITVPAPTPKRPVAAKANNSAKKATPPDDQTEPTVMRAISWLIGLDPLLSSEWPSEFPPESDPHFWTIAARAEMQERTILSSETLRLIEGEIEPHALPALRAWLFRRRGEWAAQLFLGAVQKGYQPEGDLKQMLCWALIHSWEKDGCIGFWTHAVERGGKPHPENLDGFSPVEL